jgi:hypothetical protein
LRDQVDLTLIGQAPFANEGGFVLGDQTPCDRIDARLRRKHRLLR